MASRESVAKKINIKNLPKVELDVYSKIALNKLVVYAVHILQKQGVTATVEEIVSICFRIFPHSFSLKHYPRWPDSALVIRRLNDAREKGNIKGNAAEGFSLKYKGRQLAKRVARALGLAAPAPVHAKKKPAPIKPVQTQAGKTKVIPQKNRYKKQSSQPVKEKILRKKSAVKSAKPKQMSMALPLPQAKKVKPAQPSSQRKKTIKAEKIIAPAVPSHLSKEEKAKAGKVIRLMESSDAYRQYKKNGSKSKISEFDFRSLLLCTMESSPETLARNVNLFKGYVNIHDRQDLANFLNYCEESFASLLIPTGKKINK